MGFMLENRAAAWLFGPLRRPQGDKARKEQEQVAGAPDAQGAERAFDIADCMEKGLARELVSDFVQPLQESSKLWKFNVERSQDRRQYRLYCDHGDFLMFAQVSKDGQNVGFFLYDPRGEDDRLYDPERPAFTMSCDASRTNWSLLQERCDCNYAPQHVGCDCAGKQEVLYVHHSREGVGSGISHCMEVYLAPNAACEEQRLLSRLPTWNEEVQSMVLDFHGRRVLASAKNFQLAHEENPEHVVCQQGKLGPDTFSLDFKYPLTVIQAFGISLTTLHWV